jgi:hypothetical protein
MTNFEMLVCGVKHIAENHGFKPNTEEWESYGEVWIFGGCNVPTICDVQMLCDDLGIPREFIETNDFGIDIYIPQDWFDLESDKPFNGQCMWKKHNASFSE